MHTLKNAEDLQQLQARLGFVLATDQPRWGVMNAGEMICHLRGAFRTAMGEISCDPVPVPLPRTAFKALALWAPLEWKKNFPTVPSLMRGTPVMTTGEFTTDRAEALGEMQRFCLPDQRRVDHAYFGSMTLEDWMRWGYLHTDHHLRQFGR